MRETRTNVVGPVGTLTSTLVHLLEILDVFGPVGTFISTLFNLWIYEENVGQTGSWVIFLVLWIGIFVSSDHFLDFSYHERGWQP